MFIFLPPVTERRQILIEKLTFDKILTWLRAFRGKIANFSRLHCLAIPRGDLGTKEAKQMQIKDQKASESW